MNEIQHDGSHSLSNVEFPAQDVQKTKNIAHLRRIYFSKYIHKTDCVYYKHTVLL
jgi:hypothetical protein